MSSMPTTDETASALPAAAVAGLITDSPTQTDLSVVPSHTAPIQSGSPQVHPTVPPLDDALIASITPLQNDNWLAWKTRVSIVLQRRGLFHLVTGSEPQPTPTTTSTSSTDDDATQIQSWHVRDLVAQELIVCTISNRQLVHVFGCRTAAAMWHALVTVHEPETWWSPARVALERRLYMTTCADEDADVPMHLDAMITLRHRLGVAGMTVGDAEFAGIVVGSLPPSWRGFAAAWKLDKTRGRSVPEIVSVLNAEYERRKAEADGVGKITYTGREASKGRSRSKVLKCDICSKFGHADKDCWFNPANRGKGRVNKGSRLGANRAGKERTHVRRVQQAIAPVEWGLDEWDV